jgi:inorganic pyrophosphatase
VPNSTKIAIKKINDVSRQLLSRIQSVQKNSQNTHDLAETSEDENSKEISQLPELMSQRKELITHLFSHFSSIDISSEQALLIEMTSLDNELTSQSKACKNIITEQIIKLKNSTKIIKSYKKY